MSYPRSEHENKFDRQMRLWGSHGQRKLEGSSVCLLGSTATGSETLKNLVLPNLLRFTIVDDEVVTETDLGNNFFVDSSSLGQSRAASVCRWMMEMNSECKGTVVETNPAEIISSDVSFFASFSLVIATQLPNSVVRPLASYLFTLNIPLIIIRTYGLLGVARLQIKEHAIIESHPNNDRYDLYVHPAQLQHWPELRSFIEQFKLLPKPIVDENTQMTSSTAETPADQIDWSTDTEAHAHIPYIAILSQCLSLWVAKHSCPPSSYTEREEFGRFILDLSWEGETNFDEAKENKHRVCNIPQLDRYTALLLEDPVLTSLHTLPTNCAHFKFWLTIGAIKRFIEKEGHGINLPVSTSLPDMHTRTLWYIKLKHIFTEKSIQDTNAVYTHLLTIMTELGYGSREKEFGLTIDYVEEFVKHVRELRFIRTRSIEQEYGSIDSICTKTQSTDNSTPNHHISPSPYLSDQINSLLEEESFEEMDNSLTESSIESVQVLSPPLVHWYITLRAVDIFYEKHGHYPGLLTEEEVNEEILITTPQWTVDAQELFASTEQFYKDYGLNGLSVDKNTCIEVSRYGASEPHPIASIMGGIGAQMSLKILLQQYVPLNNTFLYDGIHCKSGTFNF